MASRLWQAVTPEPHEWITSPGARSPRSGAELLAQPVGRLEAAAGAEVGLVEAVERAGDVAGDRIDRLGLAAEALAARASRTARRGGRAGDAGGVDARQRATAARGRARRAGTGASRRSVRAPPARCQAATPPSSTATCGVAEPAQHPPEARRVDAALRVERDDLASRARCRARRPCARSRRGRAADGGRCGRSSAPLRSRSRWR